MSISLDAARGSFGDATGYLAVASMGLPTKQTVAAITHDLERWCAADRDPQGYDRHVAAARRHYAKIVGVDSSRVAIGAQTSVMVSLLAADLPPGAEVLGVEGDFSSVLFPFLTRGDLVVRTVPLEALADSVGASTALVAFSLIQSARGQVADVGAILEATRFVGARTLCDATQAAGVHTVDASAFDATVCHAYKWLCSPRGVAFLTVSEEWGSKLRPLQAGWYGGEDVWTSVYGPAMHLAHDARRFDVSPAWQAWIGAEPALELFAELDPAETWRHAAGLGARLTTELGLPEQKQAIVSIPDADGALLAAALAEGIRISGRAGRLRASFHLWNTEEDVAALVRVVRRAGLPEPA
ncbi:MAG: aminotransferase class V-fold PLP-dependent enzyme [Microcella sp.]|uniref:aminotransferase class V-fold PLP-dependent enzyme n=1 Tax=Microcella sp. TaxID=1913979 RepID=UPI003315F2A3